VHPPPRGGAPALPGARTGLRGPHHPDLDKGPARTGVRARLVRRSRGGAGCGSSWPPPAVYPPAAATRGSVGDVAGAISVTGGGPGRAGVAHVSSSEEIGHRDVGRRRIRRGWRRT